MRTFVNAQRQESLKMICSTRNWVSAQGEFTPSDPARENPHIASSRGRQISIWVFGLGNADVKLLMWLAYLVVWIWNTDASCESGRVALKYRCEAVSVNSWIADLHVWTWNTDVSCESLRVSCESLRVDLKYRCVHSLYMRLFWLHSC